MFDDDLFRRYIRDIKASSIGRLDVDAEEEINRANIIAFGNAVESAETFKKFVFANLRLVISIAKRYRNLGVPLIDLIQEGNISLFKAIEKFDGRNKFSTYATLLIQQRIKLALSEQGTGINLPIPVGDKIRQISRVARGLVDDRGKLPSDLEIAEIMGVKVSCIRAHREYAKISVTSMDTPVGEDGGVLSDFIADPTAVHPSEHIEERDRKTILERVLRTLPPRESEILRYRFGFLTDLPLTLDEVGQKFNLSSERIRQIEAKALRKLRDYGRLSILRSMRNGVEPDPFLQAATLPWTPAKKQTKRVSERKYPPLPIPRIGNIPSVETNGMEILSPPDRLRKGALLGYGVTLEEFNSPGRGKVRITFSRHVVVYILSSDFKWSDQAIVTYLDRRGDYSLVKYAKQRVARLEKEIWFKEDMTKLRVWYKAQS